MALKRLKTKRSKRLTGRLKHKIDKKVREHKRKERREIKKKPRRSGSAKQKLIQVPNTCPFKADILKEVQETKVKQESNKGRYGINSESNDLQDLNFIIDSAASREEIYSAKHRKADEETYVSIKNKEQSLKQFFKEFKNVIQNADVILEVVDARDPLGTRCVEVERAIRSAPGNKRLVLVLNKADLVPRENLENWIKYFRRQGPVTAFKASTQNQSSKLGRRKFHETKTEKAMQGSLCIGAELLMSMLGNYCRNNGIKTSIRVGIVGIPNVGKSSIINSLTRGKTCVVGCTPGVTKVMQEVELDSKIKLLDCPGIVFPSSGHNTMETMVLKNAQRVSNVKDPFTLAESILKRASKDYFCKLYDLTEYASFEEFFTKKASRMGKFLRKGVPDVVAAARSVLNDWNSGKIKYCTQPPEANQQDGIHLSASIMCADAQEFSVDNISEIEKEFLKELENTNEEVMQIQSCGPLELKMGMGENEIMKSPDAMVTEDQKTSKKRKMCEADNAKRDPVMKLEGNMSLNKNIKEFMKKRKKQTVRSEKKMSNLIDGLDGVTLATNTNDNNDM